MQNITTLLIFDLLISKFDVEINLISAKITQVLFSL